MKIDRLGIRHASCILLILSLASVTGCVTSSSFQQWAGPSEFCGKGGAFKTVEGIEIWETGSPAKKFKILGITEIKVISSAGFLVFFGDSWTEKEIVKEAKRRGGDAIILITGNVDTFGFAPDPPATASRKVAVIKYIE